MVLVQSVASALRFYICAATLPNLTASCNPTPIPDPTPAEFAACKLEKAGQLARRIVVLADKRGRLRRLTECRDRGLAFLHGGGASRRGQRAKRQGEHEGNQGKDTQQFQ